MAKGTLYEQIKLKGQKEAEAIVEQGKVEANALYQKMISDSRTHFEVSNEKAEKKSKATIDSKEQMNRRALRDENALAKQALISGVFEEIKTYLENLKGKDLFNYVKSALQKETIEGNEHIQVSKKDYETYRSILASTTGDLVDADLLNKELGAKAHLKLSKQPANIESGFIVVGKIFDLNFSYEETIQRLTTKYEKEIYEEMK